MYKLVSRSRDLGTVHSSSQHCVLVGCSLHGVLNNEALCVCSKYTTVKIGVLKYYIGVNTKPSETNYLMPVCKEYLPIGHFILESNFTVVLMYFTFIYESVG